MRDNSLTYTLASSTATVTMQPEAATNDVWIEDAAFKSAVRGESSGRAQGHGGTVNQSWRGTGIWSGTIRVKGTTGPTGDMEANRVSLASVLNSMYDSTGVLSWTHPATGALTKLSPLTLIDDDWRIDGSSWVVSVQAETPRPYAWDAAQSIIDSAALTTGGGGFTIPLTLPVTLTPSGGGTVAYPGGGDWPSEPTLKVYGPIINPIVSTTTPAGVLVRLVFSGSIAAGDYWEINLAARTVKLNGTSKVFALDVAQSTWFQMPTTPSTLTLAGSGFTAATLLRVQPERAWG